MVNKPAFTRIVVALLSLASLTIAGATLAVAQGREQADGVRRETAAALAGLRSVIDEAEARWRREFVGKLTSRTGQPLPERDVLAEIRRARQSLADAARIETLWTDLEQQRLDVYRFGVEVDAIFEQAVVTTWDVHVAEARRMVGLLQQRADDQLGRLAGEWSATVAALQRRDGLSSSARQQLIDAAAAPVRRTEEEARAALGRDLDAVADRLVRARRQLLDLVTARVAAARAAGRIGAPERLSALVQTHFESGASGGAGASSFDTLIAASQVRLRTIFLRGQPQALSLAERIQALSAERAVAEVPANRIVPEPPPRPRILGITVLEGPEEYYPLVHDAPAVISRWTLFVLGRDLLQTRNGQPVPGIDYGPFRLGPVLTLPGTEGPALPSHRPLTLPFEDRQRLPRIDGDGRTVFYSSEAGAHGVGAANGDPQLLEGFEKTAFGFSLDDPTASRTLDGLVVNASLHPNIVPGFQSLQIGPARAQWWLPRGTHQGSLRFVRVVSVPRNEHDYLQRVFMPDTVQLELTVEQPIAEDQVRLVVYRNGTMVDFGLQDEVIVARRLPGNPRVYRSAPILIHEEGRSHPDQGSTQLSMSARSDYTLVAMVLDPWFRTTPVDRVTVHATPAEVRVDGRSALWKDAVAEAAGLWGKHIRDWNTLSVEGADSVTSVYVFQLDWHTTRFTIADHAAMLLLRRQFIDMAREQKAQLQRMLQDEALLWGYHRTLAPLMSRMVGSSHPSLPLAAIPVPERVVRNAPPGAVPTVPWVRAFDFAYLRKEFGRFPGLQAAWQLNAARHGIATQLEWLDRAIARAQAIDSKNLSALVNLTGDSYEPVIERVMPLMLKLTDVKNAAGVPVAARWEPDQAARDALTRIRTIMAELASARKAARADTEALLAISVLALGNPTALVSKVILAAASAGSIAAATGDLQTIAGHEAEVDFARGAGPVIGFDRFNIAKARSVMPSWIPYATFFASVIGLRIDIDDLVRAVRLSHAYRLAESAADAVARTGTRWMRQASEDQLRAFLIAAEDSRLARELAAESGRALTPAQSKILAAVDKLEAEVIATSRVAADGPPAHWGVGTERYTAQEAAAAARHASRLIVDLQTSGVSGLGKLSRQDQRALFIALDEAESARVAGRVTTEQRQLLDGSESLARKIAEEGVDPAAVLPARTSTLDQAATSVAGPRRSHATPGMPQPGHPFSLPGLAKPLVLGKLRGKGAYAVVYDLTNQPGTVAKIVRHDPERLGTLDEVLRRMDEGAKVLEKYKNTIPQLKTLSVRQYGNYGIVIQEALPDTWKLFDDIPIQAAYDAGFELLMKLRGEGLAWWDCHFKNMFFIPQANGRFVAGILDPDMIMRPGQAAGGLDMAQRLTAMEELGGAAALHESRAIQSLDDTGRPLFDVDQAMWETVNPQRTMQWNIDEFTVRMLEYRGYIKFHRFTERALRSGTTSRRGLWRNGLIELDRVERAMGGGSLDRFVTWGDRIRRQPPPSPGRSWLGPAVDQVLAAIRGWLLTPAFARLQPAAA